MMDRRQLLITGALGSATWFFRPRLAFANAATERRFVFIIQRGAADGLDLVRPYGDPAFAGLRGALIDAAEPGLKLDGMFALHPELAQFGNLFLQKQAVLYHAVASSYRERSHFDGQNVLETAGGQPYSLKDGWLNRIVALLPSAAEGIAISPMMPMALRGTARATTYTPSSLPEPSADLLDQVTRLYEADPQLHALWTAAVDTRNLANSLTDDQRQIDIGRLAARFLRSPSGPRIAMMETLGWDTHTGQVNRLKNAARGLDRLITALRDGMGPVWANTTVLIATEFGRTVAVNGTAGTDHGTGSVAMVLGGALDGGGRIVADWPGLARNQRYEGRDLKPTTGLEYVIAQVVSQALNIDPDRAAHAVFQKR